jgi:mannosyltransferase
VNHATDPEVIVFNLKRRFTGVSATVNALVPIQQRRWRLMYCGTDLPNGVAGVEVREALSISRSAPRDRPFRIWHVRRDHEMMWGLWARDVLRLPIRLVFTSAAQHRHGWFPRWLISKMDAVISTTPLAASFVPNTTAVVPHGIDLGRFVPPGDKLMAWSESGLPGRYGVGVFGRVRPDKGTDIFVDAMIQALPGLPEVTAIVAGLAQPRHQAFQKDLIDRVHRAGLADRIIFLGEVPAREVHLWYQRCLVCVACPRYEPFGLTPFEAAACGAALICSRTGAFDQLVEPDISGHLVELEDARAIASGLQGILRDPRRAIEMGQAARRAVEARFTLEAEEQGIAAVYQRLFSGGHPSESD